MDHEATVIREEMNHTRADLDQKLLRLEARARELRPSSMARRYLPDYPVDRAIGAVLTLIGTRMAWSMWRQRANRRARLQHALGSHGSWDQ